MGIIENTINDIWESARALGNMTEHKANILAGRYHYHFLPTSTLPSFEAPTASCDRGSHRRNHTGSIRHDAYPWISAGHLPHGLHGRSQPCRQSGSDIVPIPGRLGGQPPHVPVQLAHCLERWACRYDTTIWIGKCNCLGPVQRVP